MQFITFSVLWKRIKAIKFMMRDKEVPLRKKLLVVFGLVYLVLPVDLIPPVLFPIGFLDDLVLWLYILISLKETLDKYWVGEPEVDLKKKYRGKTVIEEVSFEVKDDEKETDQNKAKDNHNDNDKNSDR